MRHLQPIDVPVRVGKRIKPRPTASALRTLPHLHRSFVHLLPRCSSAGPSSDGSEEREMRRKRRVVRELMEYAGKRGHTVDKITLGTDSLETLLPGFQIDLSKMKIADWVRLVTDMQGTARTIIVLKTLYPSLNLSTVLMSNPKLLLKSTEELQKNAEQVQFLMQGAQDADAILAAIPQLMDPQVLVSVLVTVKRWYPKRKPLDVLQADPDLLRRAQSYDVPLEPVFLEGGNYVAPEFTREAKEPWQKWIRENVYKKHYELGQQ